MGTTGKFPMTIIEGARVYVRNSILTSRTSDQRDGTRDEKDGFLRGTGYRLPFLALGIKGSHELGT